jgi:hypothetical protein
VAILLKYHANSDPGRAAVRAEIQEIRETLALEKRLGLSFREVMTSSHHQSFTSSK